jgi:hypothetical protein
MAHLIGCGTTTIDLLHPKIADIYGFSVHSARQLVYLKRAFANLKLSVFRKKRDYRSPLIIFGGYGVNNPEPVADLADIVCVGDGEFIADKLRELKSEEYDKQAVLRELKDVPGVFVPEEEPIRKRWARKMPAEMIVKAADVEELRETPFVMTRATRYDGVPALEMARGCHNSCPYCTIGWTKRYKKNYGRKHKLFAADIPGVRWFWDAGWVKTPATNATVNMVFKRPELISKMSQFVFGIEGMSERLRKLIWKPASGERLIELCKLLGDAGKKKITWFMMHSFPTEGAADREEFSRLQKDIPPTVSLEFHFAPFQKSPFTPLSYFHCEFNHESRDYIDWLKSEFRTEVTRMVYQGRKEAKHILDTTLSCGGRGIAQLLATVGHTLLSRTEEQLRYMFRAVGSDYDEIVREWPDTPYLPWGYVDFSVNKMAVEKGRDIIRKKLVEQGYVSAV